MPVKDKQGAMRTHGKEQEIRWKEYFEEALNRSEPAEIPAAESDPDVDIGAPRDLYSNQSTEE